MKKKLDAGTISEYFIDYPKYSKGYRFYCPTYNTRIIEIENVWFIGKG